MFKQIMIPVAAFAVTVTGASAFSADTIEKLNLDLSTEQTSALEEAHEMRLEGADRSEIKTLLEEAGLDKDTMKEIKDAAHEYKSEKKAAIHEALENEDYSAYQAAVADSPREELITSEADFQKLVEAHALRAAGDKEGAAEIMSELGFEKPEGHGFGKGGKRGGHGGPGFDGDRQSAEA